MPAAGPIAGTRTASVVSATGFRTFAWACALERARSLSQGAILRPRRTRGQPRRGRKGILLLPRCYADSLLHEDAVQVPSGRISLRAGSPTSREGAAGKTRNSSCSMRSPMPFAPAGTSTFSSSTPEPTRKTSSAASRRSTAEPSSRPCTYCRTSGFAIPGPGGIPMIDPSYKRSASHRSG